MTESTLLQQARHHMCRVSDEAIGGCYERPSGFALHLRQAVDAILQHLEERHEAARAPQVVPDARQVPARSNAEQIAEMAGVSLVPPTVVDHFLSLAPGDRIALPSRQALNNATSGFVTITLREGVAVSAERATLPPPSVEGLDLDALQALCDRATPGPWSFDDADLEVRGPDEETICDFPDVAADVTEQDARFVAAARDALPKLIATVRRLHTALAQSNADLDRLLAASARTDVVEVDHG